MSFDSAFNRFWHTVAEKFRRGRQQRFRSDFPSEVITSIIDIGGVVEQWEHDEREITVLNTMRQFSRRCKVVVGDGRRTGFPDKSFDLAYSNSVIEHVGKWADQTALASELRRIGKAVYCQTPNRWFPVEVHYLTFFLHWIPGLLQNYFVARFLTMWGWLVKPNRNQVREYANSINLLSCSKMKELFPDCLIEKERFLGLTKSLIAIRKRHDT